MTDKDVKFAAGIVIVGVLSLLTFYRPGRTGKIVPASERRVMPSLALEQLGGGTWRMSEHKGQVVLVNYWATWCQPCREETPGLVRMAHEVPGLAVVGVSVDQGSRDKVKEFVRVFGVGYPVAFPEKMSQVAQGMTGVPTTILVDKAGRVAKTYEGAVGEGEFRKDVGVLLGE